MDAASPSSTRNALALLTLIGSTAAALAFVPRSSWRDIQQPSVRAAAMMVVVLLAILSLRRLGPRGASRERQLLCVFLAAMPVVYLESGLWNNAGRWLLIEGAGLVLFSAWAWLAYRRDAAWLACGIAGHGLLWDSWHTESSYIPAWYGRACLVVDLGLALYVLLERDRLALAPTGAPVPLARALDSAPPQVAAHPLPVIDAQVAAIRAEMLSDLATTLGTLQRVYGGLAQGAHGDASQHPERYAADAQDVRTVLTRLRLLLPSLKAGRMVMPDMTAQRQQTAVVREQAERAWSELGVTVAAAQHSELFRQAIEGVLETAKHALGAGQDGEPTLPTLDTLGEQVERAQVATQVLQLTLTKR